jgi:hypothetical protein
MPTTYHAMILLSTNQIPGLKLTKVSEVALYNEGLQRYNLRKANNKKNQVGL